MTKISEPEFARICREIYQDRDTICRHNPNGTREATLLWMLLGCLISYLNLAEIETPCFAGKPTAETYQDAILFVLKNRKTDDFNAEPHLEKLTKE
jgi:hypothetical protein